MFARTLIYVPLSIGLVALLLAGTLGLAHAGMSMAMDDHGNMVMTDCYMPGMTTLCNMDVLAHISSWQAMLTTLPVQDVTLGLLLLLGVVVVVAFVWLRHHAPPETWRISYSALRQREYALPVPLLQELFSSGVLHPKLF